MYSMFNEGKRVLLVDDSPLIRAIARDLLLEDGFSVEEATDGKDAIVKLAWMERYPDVIVLDLLMPGMDGYELIHYLEETERLSVIPVIVMTALLHAPVPEGTRVVHKPIDPDELILAVRASCPRAYDPSTAPTIP